MRHLVVGLAAALLVLPLAVSAPAPKGVKGASILVFDDCDEAYSGKDKYEDHLTRIGPDGTETFRLSGFNNCQSIGSSRMIAVDPARKCFWVIELVAHRLRRFDLTGKETLAIDGVPASAIAVDPETGNVWALAGLGRMARSKTVVYDPAGTQVASHDVTGWDIVYDRKAKAFWIADQKLTKITVAGKIEFSIPVANYSTSTLDVDQSTGTAWVGALNRGEEKSRVVKVSAEGKELASIELNDKVPFRVSADSKTGGVWVANFRKSIAHFTADGTMKAEQLVEALAVHYDAAADLVWVVTPEETQKRTPGGEIKARLKHAKRTEQAWMAALE